jgi:hypothetical protein
MNVDGLGWIEQLPVELAGQRELLTGLLRLCQREDRVRWLVVGCSVARGAGDWMSDLDMAVGVRDDSFAAVLPVIREAVDGLGELVESYQHQLPSVTETHERIFAQFADRGQVDLMVFPASVPGGSVPGVVVLYDADGQLVVTGDRRPVTADQIRQWAFGGWCALADLGKYLRRGSAWEALDRLGEARAQLWQLWAAALHVPDPQYGLTSILDFAPSQLPALQGTASDLDITRLLAAARCLAERLHQVGDHLPDEWRQVLPHAMATYVAKDLQQLTLSFPGPAS